MPVLSDSFTLLQDGVGAALAATASAEPTLPNLANLVANWDAADGIAHDGVAATQWTSAPGDLTLVDMGDVSDVGTSPAGGPALLTSGNVGMRAIGTGSLPVGAAARSAAVCLKVAPEAIGYCGFGWGATSGDNTAFVVGVDGDGNAAVDFRGARLASDTNIWGRDVVVSADYDGTTVRLYLDGTFLTSADVALTTGSDLVNLMTTFSGLPSGGRVMAAAVWKVALSAAAHAQVYSFWYLRHLNDITAPAASNVSLGAPKTSVSLSWAFDADEPGIFDLIVTENANVPTVAQIEAGLDGTGATAAYWLHDEPMSSSNSGVATGLSGATPYHFFASLRDSSGNRRIVNGGASVSTEAVDMLAPVLSAPAISKVLSAGYTGSVVTDEGNGTLYIHVSDTAGTPSKALVKTGDVYPVAAAGLQTFGGSWAPGTTGYGWALHVDAAGNEATSPTSLGAFTTDAVASGDLTPHTTVGSVSALTSLLDSWEANWSGTASGLGLTARDKRVVSCTFSTSNDIDLRNYDFSEGSGRKQVTIRQAGNFGQTGSGLSKRPTSTYSWSGRIKLDNAKNIRVALATISGDRRLSVNGATDITLERLNFSGSYTTPPTSSSNAPKSKYALTGTDTGNVAEFAPGSGTTTRLTVKNCLIQGFDNAGIMWTPNCVDTTFDGLVFDVIAHDTFKIGKGDHTRLTIKRCWGPRLVCSPSGTNYHEDFCQVAATSMTNFVLEDNVWWKSASDWYGNAVGVGQGLHGDDAGEGAQGISINGMVCQRNVSVMDAQPMKINTGANPNSITSGTRRADHNLFLLTGDKGSGVNLVNQSPGSGFTTKNNNIVACVSGGGSNGSNATVIDLGAGPKSADYSGYTTHITAVPGKLASSMFEALYPKVASPLHWDYTGTDKCNAGDSLKRIFVNGDHPGNVGWPVAVIWRERWNQNDAINSTYTGSFDSDGNNV